MSKKPKSPKNPAPRDFLGRILKVGDFCTFPGGGNRACEYGLLLHRVVKISDKGVQTQRLRHDYPEHKEPGVSRHTKSTIKKSAKLTIVDPPANMVRVFENPQTYPEIIGKWVHGMTIIDWDTLTY